MDADTEINMIMQRHYKISLEINSRKTKLLCERGLIGLSRDGQLYIMSEDGEKVIHTYENARVTEIAAHVIVFEGFEKINRANAIYHKHRQIYCIYA